MLIALKGVLGLSRAELAGHDPALASELDEALEKRGQPIPKELVDAPLGTIPEVLAVLDAARLDAMLSLVPLGTAARRELLGLARPEALEPEVLRALVDKAVITATEAGALGPWQIRY